MKTRFRAYNDAQHGWVAVKRKILSDMGILDKVSRCSFQRGKTVYLEEDSDALMFVRRFQELHGVRPEFTEKYTEYSPIRSYESFCLA